MAPPSSARVPEKLLEMIVMLPAYASTAPPNRDWLSADCLFRTNVLLLISQDAELLPTKNTYGSAELPRHSLNSPS